MKTDLRTRIKKYILRSAFKFGLENKRTYIAMAESIPGWVTANELAEKFDQAYHLPDDALIVEIGVFLGRSTLVTAGARKMRGSGKVVAIDPFDASGDEFSVPVYQQIERGLKRSLKEQFLDNIRSARLESYVLACVGTAESAVESQTELIDMLILDGDQSPQGARSAYEAWIPFLKSGGILVVHNSADRAYEKGHDGHRRLIVESVKSPDFEDVHCVRMTTFARKV